MADTKLSLEPGKINLDYIPLDWPLVALGSKKDAYVSGWATTPFDKQRIVEEIEGGRCKAVGLIGGPVYNEPYGLVWIDIDGPTIYPLIEEISGKSFDEAITPTLTIQSGREGRERRLYKVSKKNWEHLLRNKYRWYSKENSEDKLELLWKKHQGVLMGAHPDTDGYFTKENLGFEWATDLPELPGWIIESVKDKNKQQGKPIQETTRIVGPNFAVNSEISVERDMQLAKEAMWALPVEAVDDYDIWITIGQSLHQLDESMLEEWDNWSKQSEKYREGECHKRWLSFSEKGGRTLGSLIHIAKEHGWKPNQDHLAMNVNDDLIEKLSKELEKLEAEESAVCESILESTPTPTPKVPNTILFNAAPTYNNKKEDDKKSRKRNPYADELTEYIIAYFKDRLVFSEQYGKFFIYEYDSKGLWTSLRDLEIKKEITNIFSQLKQKDSPLPLHGYTTNLINEVIEQLKTALEFDDWYEGSQYLLFRNGILNLETMTLEEFDRLKYINEQLPYNYDAGAKAPGICSWLAHTQWGNNDRVQVLRAWLRAVLTGGSDLQKFVEIIGPGKSGKSTYANLCVALVGKKNIHASDFENIEKGRFEAGAYFGKKLLLLQDQDRWGGSVSKLKAITGGDWIRPERKYEKELEPFQFRGLVMITANESIQSTDYTSGLGRRRLTIPFDRPFTGNSSEQRELITFDSRGNAGGEFAVELPGLVNWVLEMSQAEMREYLIETNQKVEFYKYFQTEQRVASNPILDWMDNHVVWDRGVYTQLGIRKYAVPGSHLRFVASDKYLYPSYCEFCDNVGVNPVGRKRFQLLVMDIIQFQLKLKLQRAKGRTAAFIHIAVRESNKTRYADFPGLVAFSNDEKMQEQMMMND